MEVLIFLNGERGIQTLNYLCSRSNLIISVVVCNDYLTYEQSKKFRLKHFFKIVDVNSSESLEKFKLLNFDIFLVAGFPTIFKKELLNMPKLGVLNMHAGKLPSYRGGSPLNWQIINDEEKIGVSIIKMDEGIDSGDIVAETSFPLSDKDDINSVHTKANKYFIELLKKIFDKLEKSEVLPSYPQDSSKSIYWAQRTPIEGKINWRRMSARKIFNLVRALKKPYPRAFTIINSEKFYIDECIIPENSIMSSPGRFFFLQGKGHYFMCKDKAVLVTIKKLHQRQGISD